MLTTASICQLAFFFVERDAQVEVESKLEFDRPVAESPEPRMQNDPAGVG